MTKTLLFFVIAVVVFCSSAFAGTDFKCVSDCTARGYLYQMCVARCSWNDPTPVAPPPADWTSRLPSAPPPTPTPVIPQWYKPLTASDILGAQQQAEQLKALRMQNEMMEQQLHENQRLRQEQGEMEQKKTADEQNARAQQAINVQFQARMAKAAQTDPKIMDMANDPTLPVSSVMAEAIKQSEYAPEIIRYLSDHRDEAKTIFDLAPSWKDPRTGQIMRRGDPQSAIDRIGAIEAYVKTLEPKQ